MHNGADYSDPCSAQGSPFRQYNNSSNTDVGWYTFPAEYKINLAPREDNLQNRALTKPYWN